MSKPREWVDRLGFHLRTEGDPESSITIDRLAALPGQVCLTVDDDEGGEVATVWISPKELRRLADAAEALIEEREP